MIFVRTLALPRRVYGVTVPNSDGSYSVYINSLLPYAQQQEVLAHETVHIRDEHFYDLRRSLSDAEAAAHDAPPLPSVTDVCSQDGYIFPRRPLGIPTQKQLDRLLELTQKLS